VKHQPVKQGQTTTPGISSPTLSDKCVGSLTSPANLVTLKMQETGPTAYSPYPRPERLTICSTKASRSPQLFKDPECWSGRGLNLRPPTHNSWVHLWMFISLLEECLGAFAFSILVSIFLDQLFWEIAIKNHVS